MGEVWTLFVLDPVLDYRLTLAEDSISVGISKNIHELTRVCSGQSHSHSRFELHAILEDKLRVDVENFTHIVRAGQAILIPPGQHHRTMQETAGFCRVSEVRRHIKPECINTEIEHIPVLVALCTADDRNSIA